MQPIIRKVTKVLQGVYENIYGELQNVLQERKNRQGATNNKGLSGLLEPLSFSTRVFLIE